MNDFIDTQRVWLEVDLDAISHTGKIIVKNYFLLKLRLWLF